MDNSFTPTIGKDVIESLTIGMYEDSRFIFREYIQNAADQIDLAVKEGLITKEQGEVHISTNLKKRIIIIEDNATGVKNSDVQPILQNIAQSTKKRGVDKGFRGIGRLGGLAYCDKLIFETSSRGEAVRTRLEWNAALLKEIINNRDTKEEAVSVLKKVTTVFTSAEDIDNHYFKVILEGVTNEDLLDHKEIERYLSMVAPIPFATRFIFKSKIYEELSKEKYFFDEYRIYLNSEQIFKGYSTYIYKGDDDDKRKDDEIIDVSFFKEYASDGDLLFWGWHSISGKNQSLNQINYTRGFRLRKSNIQIGDEHTLLKLQRDKRFHFYFLGEIYGVHRDLIPNSRRDYFTQNDIFFEFEHKLKTFFHTVIYKLCFTASDINSSVKKIEELRTFEEEFRKKEEIGFIDKKEHQDLQERFKKKKEEARRAIKKIKKIERDLDSLDNSIPLKKIMERVLHKNQTDKVETDIEEITKRKTKFRTDNLSWLRKDQRKILSIVFSIIRDALDEKTSENLINKIEDGLK